MIKIGQILTTHGHKGEVKVFPLTDDPNRFDDLKFVFLNLPDGYTKMHINSVKYHKNFVILKLKEITDMSAAEKLRNIYICVQEEQLITLPEDHYFIFQLIGLEVYENEKYLGKVKDVIQTGSNDVYIVQGNKKEVLIPALKTVVKNIDLQTKKMFVELPEGLVD
ncbi:MAG: rRNA processing protein RimM [Clostridia bacterium]|jgi:16S rRNA processing protein RimM|nr:rRNA processing protein RimM [Clostridia bacterium]MDN5322745.1 rRNA processing protein RimM [Clostridia bacterium]